MLQISILYCTCKTQMNVNKIYVWAILFFIHGTHISHYDTTWYKIPVQWFSNSLTVMLNMVTKNQAPHSLLLH